MNRVARYVLSGAVAFGVIAGAVRLGARYFLADSIQRYSRTEPCGRLVHRATTTTRKTFSDTFPKIEGVERRIDGVDGTLLEGVDAFACGIRPDFVAIAIAAHNVSPTEATIIAFDGSTGAVVGTTRLEHSVDEIKLSQSAAWLAVASREPNARLSVVEVASGTTIRLSDDTRILASSFSWSTKDELCWVAGRRPTTEEGSAELWCWVERQTKKVTQAAWTGEGASAVWAGFPSGKPALCGRDLKPRNRDCDMAPR